MHNFHIFLSCIIAVIINTSSISADSNSSISIAEYLMELGVMLRDGTSGVPKVDPYPLSGHYQVDNDIFSGTISLDGQLSGFSNYYVSEASISPNLTANLDIIFLSTTLKGTYDLNAYIYKNIIPLTGSGPMEVYLSFIEVEATGVLVGRSQMIQMKDFEFKIAEINAVEVSLAGLLKDYHLDQVLKPSIKGVLNTAIKMFKPQLEDLVNKFVAANSNQYLRQISIDKIIQIIKNV